MDEEPSRQGETPPAASPPGDDDVEAAVAGEVVDGLPVLADDPRVVDRAQDHGTLVVGGRQAAALAATGFVAGAATVALVHRHRTKPRRIKRRKKSTPLGEIVTSNSFLVDVHLLRRE